MACLRNFSLLAFATFGLLQQSHDSQAAKVMDQGKDLTLERALARFFKGNSVSKETAAGLSKEAMGALRAAGRRAQTSPTCTTGVQIQSFAQTSDGDQAIADASREFLLEEGVADSDAHFLSNFFAELLGDAMRAPPSAFAEVGATVWDKAVAEILPRGGFAAHECDTPKIFRTGDQYYLDLYKELQTLQDGDEIIIAGWKNEFDTTNLLGDEHPESNMQKNLLRAAEKGAKVYVQFWANTVTEGMGSFGIVFHQGQEAYKLANLHENIHVLFDTGRGALMTSMWSWHIKAVVIDRKVATRDRLTIAYAAGFDIAPTRWDTRFFVRPDPRRNFKASSSGDINWIDAGVKVTGGAARDVRQALTSRHASYCSSSVNVAHRSALYGKIFWFTYDQCDVKNIPAVNPKYAEPVGSCSYSDCSEPSTTCVLGNCICQDGLRPENGKCIQILEEGGVRNAKNVQDKCRVLLTASPFSMDVGVDTMHIKDQLVKRIKDATSSVLIDSQYFIGNRGSCYHTCPQNEIILTLEKKIEQKMREGSKFAVVIFIAGKTTKAHMPTLLTLFAREERLALIPKIQKTAAELQVNWQDYVCVATTMKVADLAYMRLHYGQEYLERLGKESLADAPKDGEVSAYPPFDHSKMFIVDAKFAIVGSANLNDRSMMAPNGDAELSIEVEGQAARDFLEDAMDLYLGSKGHGSSANDADLARLANGIAAENNAELVRLFGADFAAGHWIVPHGSMNVAPCCCQASTDGACTRKSSCGSAEKIVEGEKSRCDQALLFPGRADKKASNTFVTWIEGKPLLAKLKDAAAPVRWQGIVVPLTEQLWGADLYYWQELGQYVPIVKQAFN